MRRNNGLKIALIMIALLICCVAPVLAIHETWHYSTGYQSLTYSDWSPGYNYRSTECYYVGGGYYSNNGGGAFASFQGPQGQHLTQMDIYAWNGSTYNDYVTHWIANAQPATDAAFTLSTQTPLTGQVVTYTSTSSGTPTRHDWYYGNSVQYENGPASGTVTYSNVGTYTFKYIATNAAGSHNQTKTVTVILGSPDSAAFDGTPLSGPVPHYVTLNSYGTVPSGAPAIDSIHFGVVKPDGTTLNMDGQAVQVNFFADQVGYYSVTHTVHNSLGSATLTKSNYVYAGTAPTPGVTPTPIPTPAPVQAYPTIAPIPTGIPSVINPQTYRSSIASSSIGNLTSGYIGTVDNVGTSFKNVGVSLANITGLPFQYVTPNIQTTVDLAGDLILSFAYFGHWILIALGQVISSLPAEIQGLVTLGLIYQIFILAMKGKAAIT